MKFRAVDLWVIVFSAATSAIALLFGGDQAGFASSHLLHAAAILTAIAAARFVPDRGDFWPFLRHGYAVLLFGFFYRDAASYIFIFFDHWLDPALMQVQASIFGTNPVQFIARFDSPWLLDFWMIGYGFYYLIAPLAIVLMIVRRRADIFRRTMAATAAAFFISYALFFLFPLEGPRYALKGQLPPLEGVVFYPLVMWVQNSGSIHGGCMPSSHTAVAWIVTYYVAQASRSAGRIFAILTAMLTVGCVWGRFHYLTDVLAGLSIFAVTVWVVERYKEDTAVRPARNRAPGAAQLAR